MVPQKSLNQIKNTKFLVTGGGGFIGSNLVDFLLRNNAKEVRVLDNFSTGYKLNIDEFASNPSFNLIIGFPEQIFVFWVK